MNLQEFHKLHGKKLGIATNYQRSKNTKKNILTLNTNDVFLNSNNEFKLESPIYINHNGREFYVYKGSRKGISYQVHYSTCPDMLDKKIIRSSQIHTSFFSIVKSLGLSYSAKEIYKLLGSYDLHISGQANLTTLRWSQIKDPINEICISHENNKDLIFSGVLVSEYYADNSKKYTLYKISEKCPFTFVLTESTDNNTEIISFYNLGKSIDEVICLFKKDVKEAFIKA